jgi:hypothetical protein
MMKTFSVFLLALVLFTFFSFPLFGEGEGTEDSLVQLSREIFSKLEKVATEGFELGEEMVYNEVEYLTWYHRFGVILGAIFGFLFISLLIGLIVWHGNWVGYSDVLEHGGWFFFCWVDAGLLLASLGILIPNIIGLNHLRLNPVYYVLRHLF